MKQDHVSFLLFVRAAYGTIINLRHVCTHFAGETHNEPVRYGPFLSKKIEFSRHFSGSLKRAKRARLNEALRFCGGLSRATCRRVLSYASKCFERTLYDPN